MRRLAPVALLTAAVLVSAATVARSQCTSDDDANAARKSLRKVVQCNDKILRSGPGVTCNFLPSPACAGSLAVDAAALAYGPNNPPTAEAGGSELSDQRRCQKQIGRGVTDFLKKLVYITKGKTPADAELKARKSLDKVAEKCLVTVAQHASGVVLPAVGPQCAAAVGAPGDAVAGRRAARLSARPPPHVGRPRRPEPAAAASEHPVHPERRSALGHDRRHALDDRRLHHAAHCAPSWAIRASSSRTPS